MDGTLLDLHFDNQVWNVLLPKRYGDKHALDESNARAQITARMDTQRGTLSWYCVDHWSRVLGVDVGSLEAELKSLIQVRPGAQAFLKYLADLEVRLILATNAHPKSLEPKLEQTSIGTYFEDIVSAHSVGVAKESTAFWRELEKRCSFIAAQTIVIDDNQDVLRAAREHGIAHVYGISAPDSHKDRVPASEFTCLDAFAELIDPAVKKQRRNLGISPSV